jgi:hypothetical protein
MALISRGYGDMGMVGKTIHGGILGPYSGIFHAREVPV